MLFKGFVFVNVCVCVLFPQYLNQVYSGLLATWVLLVHSFLIMP